MPRAAAFRIPAIADLLRQLEYAPAETRKRHMDAAERLVAELEEDQGYPPEFIIFRVTGYRSDSASEPVTFAGALLRADLVNLVQRLSEQLALPAARDGASAALPLEEVAARLNVSAKTVQRYRAEGLVCHVVTLDDGRQRLACYQDALARFQSTRREHLARAARFTRIGHDTEALIIDQARKLRQAQRLSLNAAATMVARRHGRALETIRQILRRHDRSAAEPIFHEPGPLRQRDVRIIHRAWIRGVDLGPLAERFGKSRATMHRAITRRRADRLLSLDIAFVALPTFAREDAEAVILSPSAVSRDLADLPPHDEALRLLQWAGGQPALAEETEDLLLAAWNYLKNAERQGIAALEEAQELDHAAGSDQVDAIETDLRWAALLHRRLGLLGLPAAIRRVEFNLGRPLATQPAEQVAALLRLAVQVVGVSLEGLDPGRGQRLERVAAFDMERELAQRGIAPATARAAARHPGGALALPRLLAGLDPWMKWLDPWGGARALAAKLPDSSGRLLALRFGWSVDPPCTLRGIAARLNLRAPTAAGRLQKAVRELRALIRAGSSTD